MPIRTRMAPPLIGSPRLRLALRCPSGRRNSRLGAAMRRSFGHLHQKIAVFGSLETILPAVDELLDGEERDQHARYGHDTGVDGERNQRRHAIAAEVEQRVLRAAPDD